VASLLFDALLPVVLCMCDVAPVHFPCRRFGWKPQNEISNGRWVMFGFAVGMLTEYATGVDFVNQIKLMVSYLGIADLE
jgi:hypothetical protein